MWWRFEGELTKVLDGTICTHSPKYDGKTSLHPSVQFESCFSVPHSTTTAVDGANAPIKLVYHAPKTKQSKKDEEERVGGNFKTRCSRPPAPHNDLLYCCVSSSWEPGGCFVAQRHQVTRGKWNRTRWKHGGRRERRFAIQKRWASVLRWLG